MPSSIYEDNIEMWAQITSMVKVENENIDNEIECLILWCFIQM